MYRSTSLLVIASLVRVCNSTPAPTGAPAIVAAQVPVRTPPRARHGGTVQVVGDHAMETVAARSGGIAVFVMDLDGDPIPPSQVTLPSVNVVVAGQTRTVPVTLSGGAFVGRTAVPAGASVAVTVPQIVVEGHSYYAVEVPAVVVVAVLPGIIVVPAVITAPSVIIPTPGIYIGKHRKHRGWGHGRGWGWR